MMADELLNQAAQAAPGGVFGAFAAFLGSLHLFATKNELKMLQEEIREDVRYIRDRVDAIHKAQ